MKTAKLLGREPANGETRGHQCVAQGERGGRRRCGRQSVQPGLGLDPRLDHPVAVFGEETVPEGRDGGDAGAEILQVGGEDAQLVRRAGVGEQNGEGRVPGLSEIAVKRFLGMDEGGAVTGRHQAGDELRADMAGLADAEHHRAAFRGAERFGRGEEVGTDGVGRRAQTRGRFVQNLARRIERCRQGGVVQGVPGEVVHVREPALPGTFVRATV